MQQLNEQTSIEKEMRNGYHYRLPFCKAPGRNQIQNAKRGKKIAEIGGCGVTLQQSAADATNSKKTTDKYWKKRRSQQRKLRRHLQLRQIKQVQTEQTKINITVKLPVKVKHNKNKKNCKSYLKKTLNIKPLLGVH